MQKLIYIFTLLATSLTMVYAVSIDSVQTKNPSLKEKKVARSVEIYTTPSCVFCVKAKKLLDEKAISYREIDVTDVVQREIMIEKSNGKRSVPQIFVDGQHIGGYSELSRMDSNGEFNSGTSH